MKKLSILSLVALFSLVGCKNNIQGDVTITDSLGREVTIDTKNVDRALCIGAGSLRLYSYVVGATGLVAAEDIDRNPGGAFEGIPVPYKDANLSYFSTLESCGTGGPKGQTPEVEKILLANPNIVISMLTDATAANTLQEALGVPVVCLSYGSSQVFNDKLKESINLLGQIFNKKARANELTSYIDSVKTELNNATKDVRDEDKKSVYLGCLGNYGVQDIYSTCANYSLFDVANIKNVVDSDHTSGGYVTIDKEALVKNYDPDIIILDAAGVAKFAATYKADKETFDNLKAFKNGDVYLQMPYNAYYTNIETALADAYYSYKIAYDVDSIDMEAKTNEITKKFLGVEMYDSIKNMPKGYGGFQKVTASFLSSLA